MTRKQKTKRTGGRDEEKQKLMKKTFNYLKKIFEDKR